ncbi:hypothetical protein AGMMS49975_25730 [Clostridia bacterium]|nr:hypothetical protein AGMMS49975_25730 [Clostridia bacterium]
MTISYPKDAFKETKALRAFICTDTSLDTQTILDYYAKRWCIEIFFKQEKTTLGFGKYQIRSIKGIKRLWLLTTLTHLMCCTAASDVNVSFGKGLRIIRKSIEYDSVFYVYNSAKNNIPISTILPKIAS